MSEYTITITPDPVPENSPQFVVRNKDERRVCYGLVVQGEPRCEGGNIEAAFAEQLAKAVSDYFGVTSAPAAIAPEFDELADTPVPPATQESPKTSKRRKAKDGKP